MGSQSQLQRFQSPLQTHRTTRTLQVAASGGSMVLPQGTGNNNSSNTTPVTYKAQSVSASTQSHHRLQSTLPASCRMQGSPRCQTWDRNGASSTNGITHGTGATLVPRA